MASDRREAPYLWRIESSASKASATITYRLRTEAGMTVFERDMQYNFGRTWLTILDALFGSRAKPCSALSTSWRNL